MIKYDYNTPAPPVQNKLTLISRSLNKNPRSFPDLQILLIVANEIQKTNSTKTKSPGKLLITKNVDINGNGT